MANEWAIGIGAGVLLFSFIVLIIISIKWLIFFIQTKRKKNPFEKDYIAWQNQIENQRKETQEYVKQIKFKMEKNGTTRIKKQV